MLQLHKPYLHLERKSGIQVLLKDGTIIDIGDTEIGTGIWESIDREQIKRIIMVWRGVEKKHIRLPDFEPLEYGVIIGGSVGGVSCREATVIKIFSPHWFLIRINEQTGEMITEGEPIGCCG